MDFTTILMAGGVFFIVMQVMQLLGNRQRSKPPLRESQSRHLERSGSRHPERSEGSQILRSAQNDSNPHPPSVSLATRIGYEGRWIDSFGRYKKFLAHLLLHHGETPNWTMADLLFYKTAGGVTGLVFLMILFDFTSPFGWILVLAGFFGPDFLLKQRVASRKDQIQKSLPGLIDLLALGLEGGVDMVTALERILEKMNHNALWKEFNIVLQEINLGAPRIDSLKRMAERVDFQDMTSLVSMIQQSEEYGSSLSTVLRNYADDMRMRRFQRAEAQAAKVPVKILFPMVVFFFPVVFIIIFFPVILSLFEGLGSGGALKWN